MKNVSFRARAGRELALVLARMEELDGTLAEQRMMHKSARQELENRAALLRRALLTGEWQAGLFEEPDELPEAVQSDAAPGALEPDPAPGGDV